MKTTYVDPLIPPHETSEETLTRLSANIGTLTELTDDAEHRGLIYLAGMFGHSRGTKVEQARALIALLTAGDKVVARALASSLPKVQPPGYEDAGTTLHFAGELMQASADPFVAERRFLLVEKIGAARSATDFRCRGRRQQQSQRALTDGRSTPASAHLRF